jgi:hypothetical protein
LAEGRLKAYELTHASWYPLFVLMDGRRPISGRAIGARTAERMVELTATGLTDTLLIAPLPFDVTNGHLAASSRPGWQALVRAALESMLDKH